MKEPEGTQRLCERHMRSLSAEEIETVSGGKVAAATSAKFLAGGEIPVPVAQNTSGHIDAAAMVLFVRPTLEF